MLGVLLALTKWLTKRAEWHQAYRDHQKGEADYAMMTNAHARYKQACIDAIYALNIYRRVHGKQAEIVAAFERDLQRHDAAEDFRHDVVRSLEE